MIPSFPDLARKVAVITGGSGSIGAATCRLLAAQKMRIAVVGRNERAVEEVREQVWNCGGEAIAVVADCTDPAAVHNAKMDTHLTAQQREDLGRSFPLGRLGEPSDVAAATAYLASDASAWVTGVTIDVAGGKVIS